MPKKVVPKTATRGIEVIGIEDQPILYANVALAQRLMDGFIITVAQGAPLIYGSLEQQEEQMNAIDRVTVRPIARLALTRATVENLRDQLNEVLALPDPTTEG
jgi:hypothetical protein